MESGARVRSVSLKRVLRIAGPGKVSCGVRRERGLKGIKKTYVLRRGVLLGFPS